ncbi:MAG: hypothetical protein EXR74_06385 [Bdellovibrionales bacterium]|nr:hypothetical protein [Bdellovibrionales bacterium]
MTLFIPFFFFLCLFSRGNMVLAFPEMLRYGYSNCITCHVSPNGGGLVTSYGRALSQEALSTWHRENESDFLWGAIKFPEWLNVGGDIRAVQTHLDTPTIKTGRYLVMQADAELAAIQGEFTFLATLGKSNTSEPTKFIDSFLSRRHFIIYHPKEELYFRAGKFQRAFGINLPDHIVSTKKGLGWNYGSETYNLEAAWIASEKDLFITGIFGRIDDSLLDQEKGVALRGGYQLGDTYKGGLSYFYGTQATSSRHVFGPYVNLGFRKDLFFLGEIDLQNQRPNGLNSNWGWAHYGRLDYELIQGIHLYLAEDLLKTDFKETGSLTQSWGGGIQFFPRPHFEWLGSYQKQRNLRIRSDYNDFFWLMMHFYL